MNAGSIVLGRSEYASESGRVGRHVRCGELKKGPEVPISILGLIQKKEVNDLFFGSGTED